MSDELKQAVEKILDELVAVDRTTDFGNLASASKVRPRKRELITIEISALLTAERERIVKIVESKKFTDPRSRGYAIDGYNKACDHIIEAINAGDGE